MFQFIVPMSYSKLPIDIGVLSGGSLTADQWLLLSMLYGPVVVQYVFITHPFPSHPISSGSSAVDCLIPDMWRRWAIDPACLVNCTGQSRKKMQGKSEDRRPQGTGRSKSTGKEGICSGQGSDCSPVSNGSTGQEAREVEGHSWVPGREGTTCHRE